MRKRKISLVEKLNFATNISMLLTFSVFTINWGIAIFCSTLLIYYKIPFPIDDAIIITIAIIASAISAYGTKLIWEWIVRKIKDI